MKQGFIALVVALGSILACNEQSTIPPVEGARIDLGEMHNKVVRAFARELNALGEDDEPITRKEFVSMVVKVSNKTFRDEGIRHDVTPREVNETLNELVDLRNRGVFDVYSPQPGDPRRIIDDWERRGLLSPADAVAARTLLNGDEIADLSAASDAVKAMNSIWLASKQLWSGSQFRLSRNLAGAHFDETPPDKESLRFQMDTIFGLLGLLVGGSPGSVVGAGVASLIIEMAPPPPVQGESWDCSDYCNMG